jgi:hypothetical protein
MNTQYTLKDHVIKDVRQFAENFRHHLILDNKIELDELEGLNKLIASEDAESIHLAIIMMEQKSNK